MVSSASVRRSAKARQRWSRRSRDALTSEGIGSRAGGSDAQPAAARTIRRAPARRLVPRLLLLLGLGRALGPLGVMRILDLLLHRRRGGAFGVDLERALPGLDGFLKEAVLQIGIAQVVVENRIVLRQVHGPLELAQGVGVAALLVERPAQAVDEIAVLRLDRQRLLDELDGLGKVRALLGVHVADVVVGLGVLGVERQDLPELTDGVVEALLLLEDHAQLEVQVLLLVVERQPLVQRRDGAVVLIGALVRRAQIEEELGAL